MFSFPEIEGKSTIDGYSDSWGFDAVKRNPFSAGYQVRKKSATFVPKKFKRSFILVKADVETLKTFYENIGYGADTFEYYDFDTDKFYLVHLGEDCLPWEFRREPSGKKYWILNSSFVQSYNQEFDMSIIEATQYQRHIEPIEDLAPGAEIMGRLIFGFEEDTTLLSVYIQVRGEPTGIDNDNTVEITIKNDAGQTVISKTYNTANQPPTNGFESLGALLIDEFEQGDMLFLDFVCGETANMPDCALQLRTEKMQIEI